VSEDSASWLGAPGAISDSLTELLRQGARGLIEKAVEVELQLLLDQYDNVTDLGGRKLVVRNGYLPEREVLTAPGPVPVRVPKVRDRSGSGVKFNSALIPPYARKAKSVEAALPWHGYRGENHYTVFQCLAHTLNWPASRWRVLDTAHQKRNWRSTKVFSMLKRQILPTCLTKATECRPVSADFDCP